MPYRLVRDSFVSWWLAALPLPVGLVLTIFDERFTSAAWRFAGGFPGGYSMWGGSLIVFGIVMQLAMIRKTDVLAVRRDALYLCGLILVGFWWVSLGMLFLWTALHDKLANPLGAVVWTAIGILYWCWGWFERKRFR